MKFNIRYNPYNNEIHFQENGCEMQDGSSFLKYQKRKIIMQNCIEDIIELINIYENISMEGVNICFEGTNEDYSILCDAIKKDKNPKSQRIKTEHTKRIISSSDAIKIIRDCYDQIAKEFESYVAKENDVLGQAVIKFKETVKPEIPICVIGNYSVGKSSFINALIGREILPSKQKATTSKNVIVHNDNKYSVSIYKSIGDEDAKYTFKISENGKIKIEARDEKNDDEIVKAITYGMDKITDADSAVYYLVDRINEYGNKKDNQIKENIEINVPFNNSLLENDRYQFAFIDTPGSNNIEIDQEAHMENLESILKEQTNALPIFIADNSCLTGKDNGELKKLLDTFEGGFSIQNIILVIAKSDDLVKSDLLEEDSELIKQWNITTKMYVSQIMGIGEKKQNKNHWIQEGYQQRYEKAKSYIVELNAPKYNKTPCGRSIPSDVRVHLPEGLIASGIPQVENEILYFAKTYADYKKSVNGRMLLLNALELADSELRRKKQELVDDKKLQKEEQDKKRQEIEQSINNVSCEFVNVVIDSTQKKYRSILSSFLEDAKQDARNYWLTVMNEKHAKDMLISHMNKFGQSELYGKNCKEIDEVVRRKYLDNIATYCVNVENCVMKHRQSLSAAAIKQLREIFNTNSNSPKLSKVEPKGLDAIKIGVRSLFSNKEKFVELYLEHYINQLAGRKGKNIGLFYRDCIQLPAMEYSRQVKKWKSTYLKKIEMELGKTGSILSTYDEQISNDEKQIRDLEIRLERLMGVRESLVELLELREM